MAGKLFLSGGGDEKQTFEVDEIFLRDINSILYISLAWNNKNYNTCREWFINAMKQHKEVSIEMLTDLSKEIDFTKFNAIYIGGGNTFKLLKKIKDTNFNKRLIEFFDQGGTIYGGSAGAIILGADINLALICKDIDTKKVNLVETSALNLINNQDIQPHFESNELVKNQDYTGKTNRDIIGIPEGSALFFDGEEFKAIGAEPITIIKKNSSKNYQVNHTISII